MRAGARPSEVPSRGVAVDARRGKAENESAPPYAVEASIDRYYFRGNSRKVLGVYISDSDVGVVLLWCACSKLGTV